MNGYGLQISARTFARAQDGQADAGHQLRLLGHSLFILLVNIGLIWPDRLQLSRQYHVTELIPLPSLQPRAVEAEASSPQVQAKLLPPAPVFETPKLTVPREVASSASASSRR